MRSIIKNSKRLVVKIGSSLIVDNSKKLDNIAISCWVKQIATLRRLGKEVVLVSSGAIAKGMKRLGWHKRPFEIDELQAAAAIGQMGLIQVYERSFTEHGICAAQILFTQEDLANRERYLNARSTLLRLLKLGVVPIINENDTVVTDEIKFGDNDTLSSLVTNLIKSDALIILTDQIGLYTADPRKDPSAVFISEANTGFPELESMAGGTESSIGRGGMLTKILAAKRAACSGANTVVANGHEADVLVRLVNGEEIGTQLTACTTVRMTERKQWIANHLQIRGHVVIDSGAIEKLKVYSKSLLPIGVVEVHGTFDRGEVISCICKDGREVARGLANYNSVETRLIQSKPSSEIKMILGYIFKSELIHRDNLVLT
ncbi:MAG: glutamate 5-kinase [Burkholderia sp.]|nr:glutamate 5-kinase [Burkholderia sp.]